MSILIEISLNNKGYSDKDSQPISRIRNNHQQPPYSASPHSIREYPSPDHHFCLGVGGHAVAVAVLRWAIAVLRIPRNRIVVHGLGPFHLVVSNEVRQNELDLHRGEEAAGANKV
jgi:hypothetical protein